MRWLMGQRDDLLGIAEEHQALYDAIAARDVRRVEELARQHVSSGDSAAREHLRLP
jgi:DNA-binding GntR family transcriptional regulator